jgi:hypothetical protein
VKRGGLLLLLVWGVLVPIAAVGLLVGHPLGLLLALVAPPLAFPWALARHVAAPLGLVRPSFLLGRMAEVTFGRDPGGGAALAASLALLRRPTPSLVVWVDARLAALEQAGGAAVAAAGLRSAATGDVDGARQLLRSVAQIAGADTPPVAARLAADWLAADAAERGAWEELASLVPATRTVRFLDALNRRQAVWLWWLIAPRRRATWALVRQALAEQAPAQQEQAPPPSDPAPREANPYRDGGSGDRLAGALAAHLELDVHRGVLLPERLSAAAARWDAALEDPSVRGLAEQRARALGVNAAPALSALASGVTEDLAEMAIASGQPLAGGHGIAGAAAARAREILLAEVELAARVLVARGMRRLPALVEWREALGLEERCARIGRLAGLPARRLVFEEVHAALCPLACRLWNDREERPLADALFRWLLAEAEAVGNSRLADHERRNVIAGR